MEDDFDYPSKFTPDETRILQRFNAAISGFPASVLEDDGMCFLGGYHASPTPPTKSKTGTLNLPQWCAEVEKVYSTFSLSLSSSDKTQTLPPVKTSTDLMELLREENFPKTHPIFPRPREHRNTAVPTMRGNGLCNPTEEQLAALDALVLKHPLIGERPSFAQYEKAEKEIGPFRRPVKSEKAAARICKANTRPAYTPGDVALEPGFNPTTDLEPGYGLHDMATSGGAYSIHDAASCLWTNTWNYWPGEPFTRHKSLSLAGKAAPDVQATKTVDLSHFYRE